MTGKVHGKGTLCHSAMPYPSRIMLPYLYTVKLTMTMPYETNL